AAQALFYFFFQAEDGIRDATVTGVQTCALPIYTWTTSRWESLHGRRGRAHRLPARGRPRVGAHHEAVGMADEERAPLRVERAVEIGRASCRERGWLVVGGGVAVVDGAVVWCGRR